MHLDERTKFGIFCAFLWMSTGAAARADEPRLAEYFGFLPVEVYKLDNRVGNLLVKDLDGDKIDDILVVNNGRSRIDLLLSTKKPGSPEDSVKKSEVNQPSYDKRMRLQSIPVNKEVVSIVAGDFNADGKIDLAYYGTPAELIILTGDGKGKFTESRKIPCGDAVESAGALTVGDLNRDGKDDLALLAANEIVAIFQEAGGKLGEPEKLPHTGSSPRFLKGD